ncbi:MAG: aspartate/tyrosine/aromatic aminotransferase [Gammaproteobacteria bacterium]|jgi:aspartate aminotransferase|nr:aspartate/tyrosine/aromatic aminotransferase [Gammaproteobacteria bacterium]
MFESLTRVPPDPILGVSAAFQKDPSTDKVDLGVGVYKDEAGKTPVPRAVRRAEQDLIAAQTTKAYLSPVGNPGFNTQVAALTFGVDLAGRKADLSLAQAPGGSGALHLGALFLAAARAGSIAYVSDPTWANHLPLLGAAGLKVERYPYYDAHTNGLAFDRMLGFLDALPADSVVVLHACCHNPTGQDLDVAQWQAVAEVLAKRRLLPFVDMAYQGLGEDLDRDAASIRLIAKAVPEMLVAVSCSKNFGVYRERTGLLAVVSANTEQASIHAGQLGRIARTVWSMPPDHGAAVVDRVLATPELRQEWVTELTHMANRINSLRSLLAEKLTTASGADFGWIKQQRGMFSRLPLRAEQVVTLREQHHIYMAPDGRINIAGISPANCTRVAESIATVMKAG